VCLSIICVTLNHAFSFQRRLRSDGVLCNGSEFCVLSSYNLSAPTIFTEVVPLQTLILKMATVVLDELLKNFH
jgi:hypothetical protein